MSSQLTVENLIQETFDFGLAAQGAIFFPEHWETECFEEELLRSIQSRDFSKFIEENYRCLPALTPDGFHKLIGYFLLYAAQFPASQAAEQLVIHLDGIQDNLYWLDRVKKLTHKEIIGIVTFLEWFASLKDIEVVTSYAADAAASWRNLSTTGE